jgi:5-methylthioadenosine/S-adenosylhomocysteine deaminase
LRDGALAVEEDRVVALGRADDLRREYGRLERIDAKGCIVAPGFVNAHTHCAMTLVRGFAEGMSLTDWLNRIWALEAKLTPSDIQLGAELGAYEALLSGTTTLNSQYFYSDDASEAHAFLKTGIRAVVGHGFFERTKEEGLKIAERMAKRWHGGGDGRIRVSVDPHAPYSTGPEAYREAVRLASRLNREIGDRGKVIVHTHVAEVQDEAKQVKDNFKVDFAGGVVNYLNDIGVLSDLVVAAHAIYLSDEEIAILRAKGVSVVLNPVSNLKLALGEAPYAKLKSAGLRIGLGTDGPGSNNTLDMVESMKILSIVQKHAMGDPSVVGSREVFEIATIGGARAIGWENEVGALKQGYKADVIVINARNMHSIPLFNEYDHLVYSARSSDVRDVFVNGKHLVQEGKLVGLDYERFYQRVEEVQASIMSRLEK